MLSRLLVALTVSVSAYGVSHAQVYEPKPIDVLLDQDVTYSDTIPTPQEALGYDLGEIIFTPDMHTAYIQAVAAVSDRVTYEVIGRSHFGRPIIRATITSPENHARLDEIQAAQLSLSQAGSGPVADDHPAIVQFTHGVHGSEPSSYDSAPMLLYYFAAAEGDAIEAMLDEVVIHQVVTVNPDGTNRFAQWTNMHHATAPVADPQHRENYYEWPWGRTNHYWFDLNRQWVPVNQPEAVAVVEATHDWLPNIAADFHEMGRNSTYFFSPGPVDGLHPLLSQDGLALNLEMNSFLAEQLDSEGALYVSEELFDDFYLGYGSSYPGLVGSVPYLFEQSSVRGIMQETEFGTLRYDDKIGQQARVALALVRAAQAHRIDLRNHLRNFFNESRRLAANDNVTGYVFTSPDRGRLADFLDMLAVHNIEVHNLGESVRANGMTFGPGEAFYVPLRQDQYRIARGLFETRVIEDKSEFYDVSGWTQTIAWDLEHAELRSARFASSAIAPGTSDALRNAPTPAQAPYAYVMEWDSYYAPRALNRLLTAGLRARVIPDAVTVETTNGTAQPGRGAIVVPITGQSLTADEIHALMVQAASEDSVTVHAATSALTPVGSDLGGFALSNIEKPEVLLVSGRGSDMYGAGELWHYLDHDQSIPVTMIDISEMGRVSLDRYTHILMPNGNYRALPDDFNETLNDWVRAGGVLIGIRGGARWAVSNELTSATWLGQGGSDEDGDNAAEPAAYATINAWDAEVAISGALFETELDLTHPLGYGIRDASLAFHKIGTAGFAPSDNPFALVARYAEDDPILSGYASRQNRELLEGAGSVFAERRGSGSVILFADNPVFRAYMRGSSKLVTNAIFFGDDFRNPGRRGAPYN